MGAITEGRVRRFLAATATSLTLAIAVGAAPARGADDGWTELIGPRGFEEWSAAGTDWKLVGAVGLDPANARRFVARPGEGRVIYNGPTGRTRNIVTTRSYGDVEVHFEFNVPKGSNSGVKFEGVYEIQIADSFGVKVPTASHCGGIYPRAELLPVYHHIDKGFPPKVNAAKPAGEWQALDVVFRAPRFDASGRKVANARVEKAVLNGVVIQEDVEVPYPTGNAWHDAERPEGPILLQADHGPVAFRNIRVRPRPVTPRGAGG